MSRCPIAVIGLACWYPDAKNPLQLWENVLSRRRQFRRFPDQRLPLNDYYDPDRKTLDKTYGFRAALIDGFEFDWAAYRVPLSSYKAADIAHWLALENAIKAIEDAGFSRKSIPGDKTGVIVGNSLTGEQTRSNTMRLRWPYVRRSLRAAAKLRGYSSSQLAEIESALENYYKSAFQPTNEDSLAGGLSNTIAGRICNYLNLHGGGYTIDGACSSSLLAVANAADGLCEGRLDLAIAGGVDISLDPFELVGFAKTGALTKQEMTVYDRKGSGFIPGEGCGFVVLKRLQDAQKDKNYIYATLQGWGISSDGGGTGLTAPSPSGQAIAIQNAYLKAPYEIDSVHFIEGHGTGTAVGDKVELTAISLAMEQVPQHSLRSCGVTSLKSIIGHTKAASGMGGFIKAVMAVNRRVIPPTAGCSEPHAIFNDTAQKLYPVTQGEILPENTTMRAGASSMGFGGINCHVTIESADPPSPKISPELSEKALLVSNQQTEIFIFAAETLDELIAGIKKLQPIALSASISELADLAAKTTKEVGSGYYRASVVAGQPDELHKKLGQLLEMLSDKLTDDGSVICDPTMTIIAAHSVSKPRIGMIFPGQGSQKINMSRFLTERFTWAQKLLDEADNVLESIHSSPISPIFLKPLDKISTATVHDEWFSELSLTEHAQPAICLSSVLWLQFLKQLGITSVAAGGHSLGELTAFYAAGIFSFSELIELAGIRGKAMTTSANGAGAMVSLLCNRQQAESIRDQATGNLVLANINSPTQMILSGEENAIGQVIQIAIDYGIKNKRLNVSNAFHSPLMNKAADVMQQQIILCNKQGFTINQHLFSSTDGSEITMNLKLEEHFSKQVISQVDFISLIENMSQHCDVLIEVGPGRVLTDLAASISANTDITCLPVESRPGNDQDLNSLLARLFVMGCEINWSKLYEGRLIRPFTPAQDKVFIENPCEYSFDGLNNDLTLYGNQTSSGFFDQLLSELTTLPPHKITTYLQSRGPFLAQVILADLKYSAVLPDNFSKESNVHQLPQTAGESAKSTQPLTQLDQDFGQTLYKLINEATGFPLDSINRNHKLLDDLNLDSIKAGDLVVEFADYYDVSDQIDPAQFANASLQDIIDAVSNLISDKTGTQPLTDSQQQLSDQSIQDIVFDEVATISGFPKTSLEPTMKLLDDLNLDSIKAGDLVVQSAEKIGISFDIEAMDYGNASLEEIIQKFTELSATQPTAQSSDTNLTQKPNKALSVILKQTSIITGYPISDIDPESVIERDLNIGREMLGTLVHRSAIELGIETQLDIEQIQDRSLSQLSMILSRMEDAKGKQISSLSATASQESWVREFCLVPKQTDTPILPDWFGKRKEDDWHASKCLLLFQTDTLETAQSLHNHLFDLGAQVQQQSYEQADKENSVKDASFSHIIAILPQIDDINDSKDILKKNIQFLSSISAPPPASQAPRRRTTVVYLQFETPGNNISNIASPYSAAAFSASLHLERSDLRLRVLTFSSILASDQIAQKTILEMSTPEPFQNVSYDSKSQRTILLSKLLQPANYTPRGIHWDSNDVIVVTGGARGITSTCALALAQKIKARFALLGRSPHPDHAPSSKTSKQISALLRRYQDKGIEAHYFSCDVTDQKALIETCEKISKTLGPITGVIHGAGLNVPRRASQVSPDEAFKEVSPKLLGAYNLMAALDDCPPKMFAALTSIIGITGMAGNSWYGFSNETLNCALSAYQNKHPETSTLALAYSIWRDEGMGAALGSVETLHKSGIYAIPTDEGVKRFVRLFMNNPGEQQVIIAARLGGLDTWQMTENAALQQLRYLEKQQLHTPGVESVFQCHLSLEQDPYIRDHLYNGTYLLPTVFGLEAMAQAASHASGIVDFNKVHIKDIHLKRPVTVSPDTGCDIVISAIVLEHEKDASLLRIQTSLGKSKTGDNIQYFSAFFEINLSDTQHADNKLIKLPKQPLPIIPGSDLYKKDLLFQGPLFQKIDTIHSITDKNGPGSIATFSTNYSSSNEAAKRAFPKHSDTILLLGDAFYRDTLLQSAMILLPDKNSLPIFIESVIIYPFMQIDECELIGEVTLCEVQDKTIINSVFATGRDGTLRESILGYTLHTLQDRPDSPTASDLADPTLRDQVILQNKLKEACESIHAVSPEVTICYLPGIHKQKETQRRERELSLLTAHVNKVFTEKGITEHRPEIDWLDSGKPVIKGKEKHGLDVSLSHDDRLCLISIDNDFCGCDTAVVTPRTRKKWSSLLTNRFDKELDHLLDFGLSLDEAGTTLWAALEALKKAHGIKQVSLEIVTHKKKTLLFKGINNGTESFVTTFPVDLTWGPKRILAFTVHQSTASKDITPELGIVSQSSYDELMTMPHLQVLEGAGPAGQTVVAIQMPVTFRPAAQLSRTIYFSNYLFWAGEVREASIWPILDKIGKQMTTGQWGSVTNFSRLVIHNDATTHDKIEIKVWADKNGGPTNSTMDLAFSFSKVLDGKKRELLASCQLQVTWVRILAMGVVKPEEYPDYYSDFIMKMLPDDPLQHHAIEPPDSYPCLQDGLKSDHLHYKAKSGPTVTPILYEESIATSLDNANLVGNIYFANYYAWQGQVRDRFFHQIAPELWTGTGIEGEMICLESRIDHLREAMPFDQIEVRMALKELKRSSMTLHFDYFRKNSSGDSEKLAFGVHQAAWVKRDQEGKPFLFPIPEKIWNSLSKFL